MDNISENKNGVIEQAVKDRNYYEKELRSVFKIERFKDTQWDVVSKVIKKEKILFIEKTGYGKSLCYQFPATQFDGTTIVFSPLIALMRDQVNYLKSIGIEAATINSEESSGGNDDTLKKAKENKLRILYVAPERQKNDKWINTVFAEDSKIKISFVVIDEAHCISTWGHDFRPSFRRIANLLKYLPGLPVLATTATATSQTVQDVKEQMGSETSVIRGDLFRDNLFLNVINTSSDEDKMVWLAEKIPLLEKPGIIYCGTRSEVEITNKWLKNMGINSAAYHAGFDSFERKQIEENFKNNKLECLIATNAFGMGVDISNIRFIIHMQFPQSPIHYYQEIGRAGRDGKRSDIFLLFNEIDKDLPQSFIDSAKPQLNHYYKVIDIIRYESLKLSDIQKIANLRKTIIENILNDLIEQKIIFKETSYYSYNKNSAAFDDKFINALRESKLKELNSIMEYCNSSICRMKYLCNYLDDPFAGNCGNCDNELNPIENKKQYVPNGNLKNILAIFLKKDNFVFLNFNLKRTNLVTGVAASYYGFSEVGKIIHECKYNNKGDFPENLVSMTVNAFLSVYGNKKTVHYILFVPPAESGELVKNFANRLALKLKIPISGDLIKSRVTEPQKTFENTALKKDNLKGAFNLKNPEKYKGKSVILVDDVYDSGATIKEIGRMLTDYELKEILPLVIAKTVSGDKL